MTRMIVKRLLVTLLVLLVVSFIIFMLAVISPLDPARVILGDGATPEAVTYLRRDLGLDEPVFQRYGSWLLQTLRGDLGVSWYGGEPVAAKIAQAGSVAKIGGSQR